MSRGRMRSLETAAEILQSISFDIRKFIDILLRRLKGIPFSVGWSNSVGMNITTHLLLAV